MSTKNDYIRLQLGDIIKLDAPSNLEIHNINYYINYIDTETIELINDKRIMTLEISKRKIIRRINKQYFFIISTCKS